MFSASLLTLLSLLSTAKDTTKHTYQATTTELIQATHPILPPTERNTPLPSFYPPLRHGCSSIPNPGDAKPSGLPHDVLPDNITCTCAIHRHQQSTMALNQNDARILLNNILHHSLLDPKCMRLPSSSHTHDDGLQNDDVNQNSPKELPHHAHIIQTSTVQYHPMQHNREPHQEHHHEHDSLVKTVPMVSSTPPPLTKWLRDWLLLVPPHLMD